MVEDDPVVAIAYRYQLRAVGAEAVAYGSSVTAALKCMADHQIDAAIVDYRLRDDFERSSDAMVGEAPHSVHRRFGLAGATTTELKQNTDFGEAGLGR